MRITRTLETQLPLEIMDEESDLLIEVLFECIVNDDELDWNIKSIYDLDNDEKISLKDLSLKSLSRIEDLVDEEVRNQAYEWLEEHRSERKEREG